MRAGIGLTAPDGVTLVADAYPADRPAPVVVTRTPYDRAVHRAEGLAWARHGFGYVVQDIRGRYGSDGVWDPYRGERADGAALVDWVRDQPWCDGRVVALGGSYAAYTAWTMAVERPATVRAVVSISAAMGLSRVKFDPSGILRLAEHATWWAERAESRTSRTGLAAAMFAADPTLIRHLPVAALPERMWPDLHRWTEVVERGPSYPDPEAVTDAELAGLSAPSLHIGGWHDLLAGETLRLWELAGEAGSLLLGPWDHDLSVVGAHPPDAVIALGDTLVGWLRSGMRRTTRVHVSGQGWTTAWPPARTVRTWEAGEGTYRYDPADPYPSADPGADRATLLARRRDAVRFTGDPLGAPVVLAGTPVVRLAAAGGADVVVRLIEVTADGRAWSLSQGAAMARGGGISSYEIEMHAVAHRLPAGSRLLLEVTGSDFPVLARALSDDRYRGTGLAPSEQIIRHVTVDLPIMEDR